MCIRDSKTPEHAAHVAMYWSWVQDYYSYVLSPFHDIITDHSDAFWRNLRLTDTLAEGGKETGIANLTKLHTKRIAYLENLLEQSNSYPFLTGSNCSYADIFLYTSIRTVQKTPGFGILRDACNGNPFSDCPIILNICDEVSKIEHVIETVGSKFTECPI